MPGTLKVMKKKFLFNARVWVWPTENAAWHLVNLPKKPSQFLHSTWKGKHRGWNSLKIEATIGKTVWKTSIFYDTRSETYLLPLKAAVRRTEGLSEGDAVRIAIEIFS
jgi:hypothetical protein